MTSLTDIALDLHDARDHAGDLRYVIRSAHRRGITLPGTEATLAITERQIDRLATLQWVMQAAVDKLCAAITIRARRSWPHEREERRLLRLLGCEELDGERWPYVAAALRARERPEEPEAFVAFVYARQVVQTEHRRAA